MDNKKTLGVVVAIVILIGAGAFYYSKKAKAPEEKAETSEKAMVEDKDVGQSLTVTLNSLNDSGESGTAILTEDGDKTKVTLNLNGAPVGVTQPAHIHSGKCDSLGGVKYPLNSPTDGKSESLLDLPYEQLKSDSDLAINVHESAEEISVYVSCGDLVF